ncbi:cytochrome P450 [Marasmius fiardii PR-910]|nr:cytochrome P450 [Marasmius fiardii PR-910]
MSNGIQAVLFTTCLLTVVVYSVLSKRRRARLLANPNRLPTPPGPKPLPIVGNILDIPREKESAAYFKMAQDYGPLVFLEVLGHTILVVNDYDTAVELFEKRGSNYSDRNELPMINLMGWDWSFGHMPYGRRWKAHRTMFHKQFQPSVVSAFWPIQLKEAHTLIRRILSDPDDLISHLKFNSASTIMNVIYGIRIADEDDHFITVAETALDGMAKAAHPGAFLVDIFPIMKHIPAWFPFAGFQKKAQYWKKAVVEMRNAPFALVESCLKQGTASPSFVTNLLNDIQLRYEEKTLKKESLVSETEMLRNCAGLGYAAGAESTVSALSSFILAMVLHPEVQAKARVELDSVVGPGRLPDFTDRDSLPYIDAIVKETLRWNPVAPLGLPHMVTKDDEFRGYHIPTGTTIMGNSWTILHSPDTFPEPMTFNPGRFFSRDPAVVDPVSVAFGYGRRICPGRFMAEAQLWISIACILHAFEIGHKEDDQGNNIPVQPKFASGMICHPLPYKCSITSRSDQTRLLVEETALL